MRKVLVVLSLVVALMAAPQPAQAEDGAKRIGVAGVTSWPEIYEVIDKLNKDFGIPIYDGCIPEQKCILISHFRNSRDMAGWAEYTPGSFGHGKIRVNDAYDKGRWFRLQLLMHEFGHVLGLDHTNDCYTSMQPTIGQCGHYVYGFTANEQGRLREIWGG